jgi:autotransporter-associated beta strand protein
MPWVAGPSLPIATTAAAALTYGSAVDLFGGFHGTQATSAVLQLADGATAWATTTSLSPGRAAGGIGETGVYPPNNGDSTTDIFNFGGVSQGQTTNSVSNYTSESTFTPMSTARSYFAYVVAPGDTGSSTEYLYAIGGLNGSNQALASVARYDAAANTWATVSPLPLPAGQGLSHTTAAYDGAGHIFVFGGTDSSGTSVNTVYRYTIATDNWDTATPLPTSTSDASALYAAYGQIYMIGGRTIQGGVSTVLNTVWNFDPVLTTTKNGVTTPGVWIADTSLPSAVYDAATVVDANGDINVIGGTNASGSAVTNVWITPVDAPPQGLPAYPTLSFPVSADITNYFTYNGSPETAAAFAYASDGVTPVTGTFTYTYNGSSAPPTNAGTYQVLAHFVSSDPGYVDGYINGQLTIASAYPAISVTGSGTFPYDGQPHPISATQVGINGVTPVNGNFTYTYTNTATNTASSTPPTAPGTYTAVATFNSSDPNYYSWSDPVPYSGSTITVTISDPTIPTGLTITPASTSSLTLSWNAAWEATPSLTPASSYNLYEQLWHPGTHGPKGGGGTPGYYYFVSVATGVSGTNYTISGLSAASYSAGYHTYAVTSVSPTNVESPKSALVTGQPKYAPSFAYSLVGGALVNTDTVEVGQTATNVTMQFYGNEPPTITMVSGPPTMSINQSTGVISYTPAASEYGHGPVTATFQAVNSLGTATASFTFNIIARPTVVITGGTFTYDGNTHAATAVAYGVDGVTPINGTFSFTYAPQQYPTSASTAPYAEVGTYIVSATFYSSDPNYGGATASGTLINIVPATPTIVIDSGPFGYTGTQQPTTATAYGVDGVTPVNGTFSFTYNGSTTPPTAPGTYWVVASFTPTPNPFVAWLDYTSATGIAKMTILPNGAVTIQSGTVQGGIQGPVSLIMTGPGMATLNGPNSYTGGTYVTGGMLIVIDPTALPDGGSLTIGSDAAFEPLPAPVAAESAVASGGNTSSAPTTYTATNTAQVDVTVHDQALLLHLSVNNRPAASLVIPLRSSTGSTDPFSDGSSNRDHDIALLLHMSTAN